MDEVSREGTQRRSMSGPGITHVFVDGIVAQRDHQPYVKLSVNGEGAQLSIAEAHKIAGDIEAMAARTEADAMILRFFSAKEFPEGAAAAMLVHFRKFRQEQDEKPVDSMIVDPDSGESVR
jgi:hypothetical protein